MDGFRDAGVLAQYDIQPNTDQSVDKPTSRFVYIFNNLLLSRCILTYLYMHVDTSPLSVPYFLKSYSQWGD
jgi:hypothetical protein